MAVRFNFQASFSLSNRRELKSFITNIFKLEGKKLKKLDYIFCDDPYLLKLNQSFLSHDYFTDIITFDLSLEGKEEMIGEIYISIDTVRTNAEKFETGFINELHRVMFHGVLHLCGYGDKSPSEIKLMRRLENKYLKNYHNGVSSTNHSFSPKHKIPR